MKHDEQTILLANESPGMTGNKLLLEKIKSFDISNTAIFSGAGIDPDGLASSEVMRQIVERNDGKATVFYRGSFNRPQNKTMRQALGFILKSLDEFSESDGYTCYISVDGPSSVCPIKPHFIVDHHEQDESAIEGNDVRIIGSCSAIMWEYAIKDGIEFTTEEGAKLATA